MSEVSVISVTCEQRVYPPYDDMHGTPHAMLLRRVSITTPQAKRRSSRRIMVIPDG